MPYRIEKRAENRRNVRHLKVVGRGNVLEVVDIESGESIANVDAVRVETDIELATGYRTVTVKITLIGIPVDYEECIIDGSVASVIVDETRLIEQKAGQNGTLLDI